MDTETGLVYLRMRYYDPVTGRFTQEDPAKDGTNWYAYCGGNPTVFADPMGLAFKQIVMQEVRLCRVTPAPKNVLSTRHPKILALQFQLTTVYMTV